MLWVAHYNSEDLGRLDLNSGQYTVRRLKNPVDGSPLEPEHLSLGQGGQVFVFATSGDLLNVQGEVVKRFGSKFSRYEDILISPSGQWVLSPLKLQQFDSRGKAVKTVQLWVPDAANNPHLTAFAPDFRSLFSFNLDESFTQWNLQTAKRMRRFGNADGIPRQAVPSQLRVSRDGRYFVTALNNGRITLWNARSGKRLTDWRELEVANYDGCCYDATYEVQVSLDGRYVVASTNQGAAIFDIVTKRAVARFDLNGALVTAFAFHPNNNRLYVATGDGVIRQYSWR